MINTKDLRDMFDEATRKAGEAISDAKIPNVTIGRDPTPGFLYFSIGLLFGALAGVVIAFLMTPSGEQARHKVGEQVDKMRKSRDEAETNGLHVATSPYGTQPPTYSTPTANFERT